MNGVQNIGAVSVIKPRSAMTGEVLQQCRQSVEECLLHRRLLLVLDMSDCPLVNSEALEFLIDAQQQCLGRGGKLVIAEPQPLCQEVLHITGVGEHVAVFDDLRSALSDFSK